MIAVAAAFGGAAYIFMGDDLLEDSSAAATETSEGDTSSTSASTETSPEDERPKPSEQGPWPKAIFDETEYSFGSMQVGTEKEHEFIIRNEGDAELKLQAGQPTCKCTAFELSDTVVGPGDQTKLLVRWIGKFKDQNFSHGGPVYTNDPANPEIRFSVGGLVDAAVDLLPEETWHMGGMSGETSLKTDGYIISRVFEDLKVDNIECDSPFIQTTVEKISSDELTEFKAVAGFKVLVTATSDLPPGLLETKLRFKLNRVEELVSVDLRASKPGPIRLLPMPGVTFSEASNGLMMGQFPASEGQKVSLLMLVNAEGMTEDLQLKTVDCNPSFASVSMEPMGSGSGETKRYKLTLEIPPGIPRTNRDASNPGRINIETNHPSGQSLQIRFAFKAF